VRSVVLALALFVTSTSLASDHPRVWLHGWNSNGQPFDLTSLRGQVVAVTFCSRYTKDEAARIHDALMSRAANGLMSVVSVVDFAGVPGFAHGYARRKIAEHDQAGRLLHLVDEQGNLKHAFQTDPEHRVDILIVDRDGSLRGRFRGENQVADALRLLDALRTPSAALDLNKL
jgi:hypothetical protein